MHEYGVAFSRCIREELTDHATQDAVHGKREGEGEQDTTGGIGNDQTAGKAPPMIPGALDSLLRY